MLCDAVEAEPAASASAGLEDLENAATEAILHLEFFCAVYLRQLGGGGD